MSVHSEMVEFALDRPVYLVAPFSGRVLGISNGSTSRDTLLITQEFIGAEHQKFILSPVSNANNKNRYICAPIHNREMVLDCPQWSNSTSTVPIYQHPYHGNLNQQFLFNSISGMSHISTTYNGKQMTIQVEGKSEDVDARVVTGSWSSGKNQLFKVAQGSAMREHCLFQDCVVTASLRVLTGMLRVQRELGISTSLRTNAIQLTIELRCINAAVIDLLRTAVTHWITPMEGFMRVNSSESVFEDDLKLNMTRLRELSKRAKRLSDGFHTASSWYYTWQAKLNELDIAIDVEETQRHQKVVEHIETAMDLGRVYNNDLGRRAQELKRADPSPSITNRTAELVREVRTAINNRLHNAHEALRKSQRTLDKMKWVPFVGIGYYVDFKNKKADFDQVRREANNARLELSRASSTQKSVQSLERLSDESQVWEDLSANLALWFYDRYQKILVFGRTHEHTTQVVEEQGNRFQEVRAWSPNDFVMWLESEADGLELVNERHYRIMREWSAQAGDSWSGKYLFLAPRDLKLMVYDIGILESNVANDIVKSIRKYTGSIVARERAWLTWNIDQLENALRSIEDTHDLASTICNSLRAQDDDWVGTELLEWTDETIFKLAKLENVPRGKALAKIAISSIEKDIIEVGDLLPVDYLYWESNHAQDLQFVENTAANMRHLLQQLGVATGAFLVLNTAGSHRPISSDYPEIRLENEDSTVVISVEANFYRFTPLPQVKLIRHNIWLPNLMTLPASMQCDITAQSNTGSFHGAFSLSKLPWGDDEADAITWFLGPSRSDLTIRTKVFRNFPKIQRHMSGFQMTVGRKVTVRCDVATTKTTYFLDGRKYVSASYPSGEVPEIGHFGFMAYGEENIYIENIEVWAAEH